MPIAILQLGPSARGICAWIVTGPSAGWSGFVGDGAAPALGKASSHGDHGRAGAAYRRRADADRRRGRRLGRGHRNARTSAREAPRAPPPRAAAGGGPARSCRNQRLGDLRADRHDRVERRSSAPERSIRDALAAQAPCHAGPRPARAARSPAKRTLPGGPWPGDGHPGPSNASAVIDLPASRFFRRPRRRACGPGRRSRS